MRLHAGAGRRRLQQGCVPVGVLLLAEHPPVAVLEQLVVRRDVVLLQTQMDRLLGSITLGKAFRAALLERADHTGLTPGTIFIFMRLASRQSGWPHAKQTEHLNMQPVGFLHRYETRLLAP